MYAEAVETAHEAGKLAMSYFERLGSFSVESKGPLDLVTQADKEVERFLTSELRRHYPDDGVFGEEGDDVRGTSGRTWVIDPIDGTFNFVRGGDRWMISIGLYEGRMPTFGVLNAPARQEFYVGGKGIASTFNGSPMPARHGLDPSRAAANAGFHPMVPVEKRLDAMRFLQANAGMIVHICGSCTISLMEVARGQVDGYVGMGESIWDLIAGVAILESLGMTSSIDWTATTLDTKFRFAAGSPEFLAAVSGIVPFGAQLAL